MAKLGVGEYALLVLLALGVLLRTLGYAYLLVAVAVALAAAYCYEKRRQSYFKRRGIPGPDPIVVYGNSEMYFKNEDMQLDMSWPEQYGPIFGMFSLGFVNGPALVVSEPEVLRHVFIKDFHNFTDRFDTGAFEALANEKRLFSKFLDIATGQRWKDRRRTVTPAFTTGRIKLMSHFVLRCLDTFDEIVARHADERTPIDIKKVCNNFTLDTIAQAALAQDINVQRDDQCIFVKYCQQMANMSTADPMFLFNMFFPRIYAFIEDTLGVPLYYAEDEQFFRQALGAIIDQRRESPSEHKPADFLQMELEALDENQNEPTAAEADAEISQLQGGRKVQLSKEEIIADCLLFLVAGFDTSSSTLQFMLYMLACNRDKQLRCQAEVDGILDKEELSYTARAKMHYVEACMHETLRLYPLLPRNMRLTNADIEYDGVTFHKGDTVVVPVWYLHHSDKYYAEPYKFEPDRFLPANRASIDPMTYMPFGAGPRNCIGMRFAQMEIVMAVARLVRSYEFGLMPDTPKPDELKFDTSAFLLKVKGAPIMLTVTKRERE